MIGLVEAPAAAAVPRRVGFARCQAALFGAGALLQQAIQQQGGDGAGRWRGRCRQQIVAEARNKAGVDIKRGKRRVRHQPRQKIEIGGEADDAVLRQRLRHAL